MKLPTTALLLVLSHCVFGDADVEKTEDNDKSIKKKADIHLVVSAGDSRQAEVVTIPIDGLAHSSRNGKTFVYPPTRVDLYPGSKSVQDGNGSQKPRRTEESDDMKPTYHEPPARPSSTDLFREQDAFEKSGGGAVLKETPSRQKPKSVYYERPYYYSNELPVPKISREKQGNFGGRASWKPMRQSRKRPGTKSEGDHQHPEIDHQRPEVDHQQADHRQRHQEDRQRKVAPESHHESYSSESVPQTVDYPKYYEASPQPEVVEENHEETSGYRVVRLPSPRIRPEYERNHFEAPRRPHVEPETKLRYVEREPETKPRYVEREPETKPRYVEREPEPRRVVQSYQSEPNFRVIRVPVSVDYEGPRSVALPNFEQAYNKPEPPRFKHQYLQFDEPRPDQRRNQPRHREQHFQAIRHYEEPRQLRQERHFRPQPPQINAYHGRQRAFYGQPNGYEMYPRPVKQYVEVEESRQVVMPFYHPSASRPRQHPDMDIFQFERRPEEELDVSDSIARPTFALPPNGIPRPGPPPQLPPPPPPRRPVNLPRAVPQRPLPATPFPNQLPTGPNPLAAAGRDGYKVVYLPYNVLQNVLQGNSPIDVLRLK